MIREIAGRHNAGIKLAKKLRKKKHRRERGLLVAEGLDLLEEAFAAEAGIVEVLVRSDLLPRLPRGLAEQAEADRLDIGVCPEEVLAATSSLGGAADVIFMCRLPDWSLGDLALSEGQTVFLDEVGDPGNVGTLVRSCVAFGGTALICSPGTADPFSPKAMRAGMGAQFLLPVVTEVTPGDLTAHLERSHGAVHEVPEGPQVVVADIHEGSDVAQIDFTQGTILVLGAERSGPGAGWSGRPRTSIPMERFDSLNVAMAGTILLYESYKARSSRQPADPAGAHAGKEES